MPASILIVDADAGNRILTRAALEDGHYRVDAVSGPEVARARIATAPPDLLLVDLGDAALGALALISEMSPRLPIIATGRFPGAAMRLRALEAGADDLCQRPLQHALLQSRIRHLLRRRETLNELALREETCRAFGLSEDAAEYGAAGRVCVLAPSDDSPALAARLPGQVRRCCAAELLEVDRQTATAEPADVIVIDAAHPPMPPGDLFRMLSEYRSQRRTRDAAQLAILPPGAPDMAVLALDLGADDIVTGGIGVAELAHRVRRLLSEKALTDRARSALHTGMRAAVVDPLTGLHNRRYALPHLAAMAQRGRETGRRVGVMVLDIDHFKAINDRHGHSTGDAVLEEVGRRLHAQLRDGDLVARIGGEEFLVALPDTTDEEAAAAAERLRSCIEDRPFRCPSPAGAPPDALTELRVTLSIGVAVGCDLPSAHGSLFDRADSALYAAKTAGRNTVTFDRPAA